MEPNNSNLLLIFYPQESPDIPANLRSKMPAAGDIYLVRDIIVSQDEYGWPMWYVSVEWQGNTPNESAARFPSRGENG